MSHVLTVGDNELIVGNNELDVGDSEVVSFGGCRAREERHWEAYKAT